MIEGTSISIALGVLSVLGILIWKLSDTLARNRQLESALTAAITEHQSELDHWQQSHQAQIQQLQQQFGEQAALQDQRDQLSARLTQISQDHQALQSRHASLEHTLLDHIQGMNTLQQQVETQRSAGAKQARQTQKYQAQLEQLQHRYQTLLDQHHQEQQQHAVTQQSLNSAQAKLADWTAQKAQLERELQRALQQIITLEDALQRSAQSPVRTPAQPSEPHLPSFSSQRR
ncbi:hypothetical protein [Lyngbya confervoides]|uniref:DNA recombination protein RmuC n=1 Tax=Lyngbya confervoides BDU141951 TaxID=1574623 RepID=A0ABD4T7T3_9CYAN|nr:hypothetical protein [Lyngbya confervoides]MCM1984584.1 hypothetical protein [Lyngbya confervoides BDU141951]